MASAKVLFGLLAVIVLVHTSHADEQADVFTSAPAVIPDYQYTELLNSSSVGPRTEAIIGTSSDMTKVYLLGGLSNIGAATTSYTFDFTASAWGNLTVNFTRVGACYAQASNTRSGIWIFGGNPGASTENADPFTFFDFGSTKFNNMTNPPDTLNRYGASCTVNADGTKFYVMFGAATPNEEDDDFDAACPFKMGVYDATAKTWTVTEPNGTITGRRGAGVAVYKNSLISFGGSCGGPIVDNDVYRLNLDTLVWSKDGINASSMAAPNVSDAAVFVIDDGLFVVGGSPQRGSEAQTYMYDLITMTWKNVATPDSALPSRSKSAYIPLINRVYFYGGETDTGTILADAQQFVLNNKCFGYKSCEDCSTLAANSGCGWCDRNNDGYKCLAGTDASAPYVASSCNDTKTYVTDIDFCPQAFPSYAIALLVIGGVVVVGVIIFAIMKVRSGDGKQEYERIS